MRKRSIGQRLALTGNFTLCAGLILNAFEIVSLNGFRILVLIGVIIELTALFFIVKRSEF